MPTKHTHTHTRTHLSPRPHPTPHQDAIIEEELVRDGESETIQSIDVLCEWLCF